MIAGIEELASRMCCGGRLESADSTLVTNRPISQTAIEFTLNGFDMTTTVPHLFVSVYTGVRLRGKTMGRSKLLNVAVDMYIVESVLGANLTITIPTNYITPPRPTNISPNIYIVEQIVKANLSCGGETSIITRHKEEAILI